jgi:predicted NodU family carbamoyl transferase
MNTVCAAGTGSFIEHQAARLHLSLEEFSLRALLSESPVRIAGRCTVFAESDMVHKQQTGHRIEDIVAGLCQALVRNYLSDVTSGKDIQSPVVFHGGVAFNRGIVKAFEEVLGTEIIVPPHHEVMGAVGAALLVVEEVADSRNGSRFRGFDTGDTEYETSSFECRACPSLCEIIQVLAGGEVLACWGGRCDMWERSAINQGASR